MLGFLPYYSYRVMSRTSACLHIRCCIAVLVIGLGLEFCNNATATNPEVARKSLANIAPVSVFVGELPGWVVSAGITRQALKDAAEHQLHEAGIPLSPSATGAGANVVIIVRGMTVNIPNDDKTPRVYSYTSTLGVVQKVRLLTANKESLATTWYSEQSGVVGPSTTAAITSVQTALDKNIRNFIADYSYANPAVETH
jgi:hypothetical protein